MILRELEVRKPDGITNRDAQSIVQRTMRYDSDIFFECGTRKINAKSLMGVISMGLTLGDKIMLIVKGDDQDEAADEVEALFKRNFKP